VKADLLRWPYQSEGDGYAVYSVPLAGGNALFYPLAPRHYLAGQALTWGTLLAVANTGASTATVRAVFHDAAGQAYAPVDLGGFPNPFTLPAGSSRLIRMFAVPGLGAGYYAAVLEADQLLQNPLASSSCRWGKAVVQCVVVELMLADAVLAAETWRCDDGTGGSPGPAGGP